MTGKYWKREINEWETTQLSMAEYCRQKKLSYWSFRIWKKRFESESIPPESPSFVKLSIPGVENSGPSTSFEIHLGNVWLRVPNNFNEKSLQRILTLLQKTDLK